MTQSNSHVEYCPPATSLQPGQPVDRIATINEDCENGHEIAQALEKALAKVIPDTVELEMLIHAMRSGTQESANSILFLLRQGVPIANVLARAKAIACDEQTHNCIASSTSSHAG